MPQISCWNCGVPPTPPTVPSSPPELIPLLTSNDVPDTPHIRSIQEFISTGKHHLGTLNVRIEALQIAIEQLIHERNSLEESVQQHEGILSPIRRLPSEIVGNIMQFASPLIRNIHGTERQHAPWPLARVCAHWRACVLADRQIWANISIYADVSYLKPFEQVFPLSMIQAQLLLSRDGPLDISFDWSSLGFAHETHFLTVLNVVLDHCNRWERVALRGPRNTPIYAALSRVKRQVPLMCRLEWLITHPAQDIDWFEVSPSLREVALGEPGASRLLSVFHVPPSSLISIPWHQITKCRAIFHENTHLDVLRRAQSLRECGLLCSRRPSRVFLGTGVVEMPHLRRLHVDDENFLDHLVAPILQDLLVHKFVSKILPFLRRSTAQLTSLTIFDWYPTLDLIPVLRASPGLTHICIGATSSPYCNADSFIPALYISDDASDLCPNLTSIMWRDESHGNQIFLQYQDVFLDMIESRWRAHSLSSLRLFLSNNRLQEGAAQRLHSLEHEGLDARVLNLSSFIKVVNPP